MIDRNEKDPFLEAFGNGKALIYARTLSEDPYRQTIINLFESGMATTDIQNEADINRIIGDLSHSLRISIIGAVLKKAIGKENFLETSKTIRNAKRVRPDVLKIGTQNQKKRFRELGYSIFSDEETEYLLYLRQQTRMKRGSVCDNDKIAAAMNKRFFTDKFTQDDCRKKFAYYNLNRKTKGSVACKTLKETQGHMEKSFLMSMLLWAIVDAEPNISDIDPDLLNAAIASVKKQIIGEKWDDVITILLGTRSKYPENLNHIFEYIIAYCCLMIGDEEQADIHFRLCADSNGPMTDKIIRARETAQSKLASNILYQLNDSVAVPPLVVVPAEDLCEV